MEQYFAEHEGTKVVGLHTRSPGLTTIIPSNTVRITSEQRKQLLINAASYEVRDGQLVEADWEPVLSDESLVLQAKQDARESILTVEQGGYEYRLTEEMQRNIILGYIAIEAADKSYCQLWCQKEDSWVFRKHGKKELAGLAALLTAKRETVSQQLDTDIQEITS